MKEEDNLIPGLKAWTKESSREEMAWATDTIFHIQLDPIAVLKAWTEETSRDEMAWYHFCWTESCFQRT